MGYNYISAAISGMPLVIRRFIQRINQMQIQDKNKILSDFKIVDLEPTCSLFVLFENFIKWREEDEKVWEKLTKLAEELKLSWAFNRTGEDHTDIEEQSNWKERYFDHKIFELFCNSEDPNLIEAINQGESSWH